jgi:hypothetical protein
MQANVTTHKNSPTSYYVPHRPDDAIREYLRGKYFCTVDLLFHWFGLVCFANKN